MPVLKTLKNGVWVPVSGMSEHTHSKNDISDLKEMVYTQPDEPIDAPVGAVWVDTDEDVGFGGGSGGSGVDVTASVGQTIVVEEVEANGKPTKWKSADYQPRTHWSEETVILPETTGVYSEDDSSFYIPFVELVGGTRYKIVYNGVEYISDCMDFREDGIGEILLGNIPLLEETGDNGLPFVCVMGTDGVDGMGAVVPLDGAETVTLCITEVKTTPIPVEYLSNAFPYYIEVVEEFDDSGVHTGWVHNDSAENIRKAYNAGCMVIMRASLSANAQFVFFYTSLMLGDINSVCIISFSSPGLTSSMHLKLYEDGTVRIADSLDGLS